MPINGNASVYRQQQPHRNIHADKYIYFRLHKWSAGNFRLSIEAMIGRPMPLRRSLALSIFLISTVVTNLAKAVFQAPPTVDSVLMQYHIPNTIPTLRAALKNPDPNIRTLVAGVLAQDKDVDSIPLLREALESEQIESVKLSIATALASLKDYKGLDSLKTTCNDRDVRPTTRLIAANRLLEGGRDDCTASVVDILGETPDPSSRELGLQYLRRITSAPSSLLPMLQTILLNELRDTSPINRQYASECISVFGDVNAIPALEKAISIEKDQATRFHLEENLHRIKARLK
jgi:HEAT repeat protein